MLLHGYAGAHFEADQYFMVEGVGSGGGDAAASKQQAARSKQQAASSKPATQSRGNAEGVGCCPNGGTNNEVIY